MKIYLLLAFCATLATCHKDPEVVMDYTNHLNNFINTRNPVTEKDHWINAREYIKSEFFEQSLEIKTQKFNATVKTPNGFEEEVAVGVNIIGISKGSKDGGIIVVGADYDTRQSATNPIANNGIGIAALLEIIGVYQRYVRSDDYTPLNTVIFVAFDLNTKKYYPESDSPVQGSEVFVEDWLIDYINNDTSKLRGSIIFDQISNYNAENETQNMITGSEKYFAEAHQSIIEDGRKGNFIGSMVDYISKNNEVFLRLEDRYNRKRNLKRPNEFRMQKFILGKAQPGDPLYGKVHDDISKGSQYPFWKNDLPAILLTDTGINRPDPCVDSKCRPKEFVSGKRKEFIDATAISVLDTLLNLQTKHEKKDSDGDSASTAQLGMVTIIVSLLTLWLRALYQ